MSTTRGSLRSTLALHTTGLRYFNVFGPRQNPRGGYAAVVPQWISTMVSGGECKVHGDGGQTRDFCHVANVVQANLLAACDQDRATAGAVYNVALGGSTTLLDLHRMIAAELAVVNPEVPVRAPLHGPARAGDIRHSSADIGKAKRELGFAPGMSVEKGLAETVRWYAGRR